MNERQEVTAFGLTVKLLWQPIEMAVPADKRSLCEDDRFYLAIPEVAKYLVLPRENCIIIEKINPDLAFEVLSTWLFGTIFAYVLQYHGYLVLHGSAIVMQGKAVIFSGESGAGKSTLAAALLKRGYQLITDDVVVIDKTPDGKMIIIPGHAKVKLWEDALAKLEHSSENLKQVLNKENKYEMPISNHGGVGIEIAQFFELNHANEVGSIECQQLFGMDKLNTLIKNTYRYNMLKPLNKSKEHLQDSSLLAKQIQMYKITRPAKKYLLDELVEVILNVTK